MYRREKETFITYNSRIHLESEQDGVDLGYGGRVYTYALMKFLLLPGEVETHYLGVVTIMCAY